jgi:hypothetical protein
MGRARWQERIVIADDLQHTQCAAIRETLGERVLWRQTDRRGSPRTRIWGRANPSTVAHHLTQVRSNVPGWSPTGSAAGRSHELSR